MGREKTEADDDALPERLEVVLVEASVDDIEEDGGDLGGAGEGVLDRRVLGEEFGGKVVVGDVLVVGREGVALEAEGADPELAAHVDLAVGIKDRAARSLARYGFVEDGREVEALLERSVEL